MHESFDEIMWPNRYLLTVLGIWPLSPSTRLRRVFSYFRIAASLSLITFMTYPLVVTIAVNWGDIDLLAGFGSVAIMYALSGVKVVYIAGRHRACTRIYQRLRGMWQESSDDEDERASFEPLARLARRITIAAFASAAIDIAAFMTSPAVAVYASRPTNKSMSLPLPVLYGFDYERADVFALLYAGQGVGSTICCAAIFGADCTFMSVIFHLAGQFRLTNFRLRAIGRKIQEARSDGPTVAEGIRACVAQHQRTIGITEEVNNVMEPLVFAQIATSGLLLCLCCFVIITRDPLDLDMFKIYLLFTCIVAQLMIWCWPGELIIKESGAIASTIYHDVPWLSLPVSLQRDLNLIVLRAQKECRIAGFYQVMSMRKLTEVFNAAGSYMALLRSIRD